MDVLERHGLRADVSATQGIIQVATYVNDLVAISADHDTAHGLTEMAHAVMRLGTSVAHSFLTVAVTRGARLHRSVVLRDRPLF